MKNVLTVKVLFVTRVDSCLMVHSRAKNEIFAEQDLTIPSIETLNGHSNERFEYFFSKFHK